MNIFPLTQTFRIDEHNYPQGGNFGPITGESLGVIFIGRGSGSITIDKSMFKLAGGLACFALSENYLNITCQNGIRTSLSFCITDPVEIERTTILRLRELPTLFQATNNLRKLFDLATGLTKSNDEIITNYRNILGEAIFTEYLCSVDKFLYLEEYPGFVTRMKQYIETHYTGDCDFDRFSQSLGVSFQYLTKVFTKYTGYTPTAYLWNMRREKAVESLRNSNFSINYISRACGFKSPYHFSNHIKKHFSYSPSEIRRRYRYNLSDD